MVSPRFVAVEDAPTSSRQPTCMGLSPAEAGSGEPVAVNSFARTRKTFVLPCVGVWARVRRSDYRSVCSSSQGKLAPMTYATIQTAGDTGGWEPWSAPGVGGFEFLSSWRFFRSSLLAGAL